MSRQGAQQFSWLVVIAVFIALAFGSGCTIQKRVHRKGWHIEWRSNKTSVAEDQNTQKKDSKPEVLSKTVSKTTSEKPNLHETNTTSQDGIGNQRDLESEAENLHRPNTDLEQIRKDEFNLREPVLDSNSESKIPNEPMSPPKPPLSAYIFLIIGAILVGGGLLLLLIFAIINSTLFGLPFPITVMIVVGIAFLFLAYGRAVNAEQQENQWSPPKQENTKKEKEERKPLRRGDKIFLAIIGAVIAVIGVALIVY